MPGKDIAHINLAQFQQPINCCNVTSLAYALTALGHTTTVDEIFYATRLPIASVLDDDMTLAETYDTCSLYLKNTPPPHCAHDLLRRPGHAVRRLRPRAGAWDHGFK